MITQSKEYYEAIAIKIYNKMTKNGLTKEESSKYATEFAKDIWKLHKSVDNILIKTEKFLDLLTT